MLLFCLHKVPLQSILMSSLCLLVCLSARIENHMAELHHFFSMWPVAPVLSPPLKLPLTFRRSPPPSNTPIPQLTPLSTPNGIHVQSAVLPQYTLRTDRPTDRQTDRQMGLATSLYQEPAAYAPYNGVVEK